MEIAILLLGIGIVIAIVFFIVRIQKTSNELWKKDALNRLKKINNRFNDKDAYVMKSCVIEADSLLDHCFKEMRVNGQTMGERLKSARQYFPKNLYHAVREAHRMRNVLIHEVDRTIPVDQLVEHYRILKKAILEISQG